MSFLLFSSRNRHTRCSLWPGIQTCALPQAHGLPALRAPGPRRHVPGHDVEMGPARGWADEVLQEQRGDDRPGIGAARDVVEVGDLAVETLAVGLVQGQAPYRVAPREAVAPGEPRQLEIGR